MNQSTYASARELISIRTVVKGKDDYVTVEALYLLLRKQFQKVDNALFACHSRTKDHNAIFIYELNAFSQVQRIFLNETAVLKRISFINKNQLAIVVDYVLNIWDLQLQRFVNKLSVYSRSTLCSVIGVGDCIVYEARAKHFGVWNMETGYRLETDTGSTIIDLQTIDSHHFASSHERSIQIWQLYKTKSINTLNITYNVTNSIDLWSKDHLICTASNLLAIYNVSSGTCIEMIDLEFEQDIYFLKRLGDKVALQLDNDKEILIVDCIKKTVVESGLETVADMQSYRPFGGIGCMLLLYSQLGIVVYNVNTNRVETVIKGEFNGHMDIVVS